MCLLSDERGHCSHKILGHFSREFQLDNSDEFSKKFSTVKLDSPTHHIYLKTFPPSPLSLSLSLRFPSSRRTVWKKTPSIPLLVIPATPPPQLFFPSPPWSKSPIPNPPLFAPSLSPTDYKFRQNFES